MMMESIRKCQEIVKECLAILDTLIRIYRWAVDRLERAIDDGIVPPECKDHDCYNEFSIYQFQVEYRKLLLDTQDVLNNIAAIHDIKSSREILGQSLKYCQEILLRQEAMEHRYEPTFWRSLMAPEEILEFWISQRFLGGVLSEYVNPDLRYTAYKLREESSSLFYLLDRLNGQLQYEISQIDNEFMRLATSTLKLSEGMK